VLGLRDGIVVEVDHAIELTHGRVAFRFDSSLAGARPLRQLDRVIDLNHYPSRKPALDLRWRTGGARRDGPTDVIFSCDCRSTRKAARRSFATLAEEFFHALTASVELSRERGRHPSVRRDGAARGELQFRAWESCPNTARWERAPRVRSVSTA